MLKSCAIANKTSVYYKLYVLAQTHGIRLWFRKVGPQLAEPAFIIFFEDNRIMLRLGHYLNLNYTNLIT